MDIDNQVSAVMADLRRAAIPGATGEAADRAAGILVDAGAQTGIERFVPSSAPLAVALEGPGVFMLSDGRRNVYSRLGDFRIDDAGRLVDGRGRAVLGFKPTSAGRLETPFPICVDAADLASKRFSSYTIDEQGVVAGIERRIEGRTGRRRETLMPIARIAIALFPAPERLQSLGVTSFVATQAAGQPSIASPGKLGAGTLRTHVVAAGSIDLEGDLRRLWALRRKGELEVALAGASDSCVRTALGLVR